MMAKTRRFLLGVTALLLLVSWPAHAGEAEVYKKKALELFRSHHLAPGRMEQAAQMYEHALERKPDDYEALWRLAQIHQLSGQAHTEKPRKIEAWKKGVEYGKRSVEVNPDGKEGHFYYMANLGSMARAKGLLSSFWAFRRIKKEMDRTLELDPDFAPALVARGQYLTEMPGIFGGDEKEAYRLYERALQADPGYRIAHFYLAELDLKNRRYEEAISHLNKIIHLPEGERTGQWYKNDLPWAENLLKEVLRRKAGGD